MAEARAATREAIRTAPPRESRADPMTRALGYLRGHTGRLIVALFASMTVGALAVADAKILQLLIDRVLRANDRDLLKFAVGAIVVVHLVKGILIFVSRYVVFQVGHRVVFQMRNDLFLHLGRLSLSYFHESRTGQLLSRLTNDVSVVQGALMLINQAILNLFQVIFCSGRMLYLEWRLALFTVLILPVLSMLVQAFSQRLRRAGNLIQTSVGDIASAVQEYLGGIREIQSFSMEEREYQRFREINEQSYRANMKGTKYSSLTTPVVELFHAAGMALVILFGARAVLESRLTVGQLVEFLACLGMMFQPVKGLTEVQNLVRQAAGAAERIFEVLDEPITIRDHPGSQPVDEVTGAVEFRGVHFAYPSKPENAVLSGIDLSIRPGEVVAIVGSSGSGKSTLVSLLPRFFDVTRGVLSLDGLDVRDIRLADLRRQFGLVPQETFLFSGTIGENIAYGQPEASEEDVRRAATDANALEFIDKLPGGLRSKVGERGVNLSGGQRQRIAIARALLKNPRILILDEATSALDTASERLVQEALERLMVGRTTFVIAHRLSTVRNADNIVVLDEGRIVEQGTHDELLAGKGVYHDFCQGQHLLDVTSE